MYTGYDQNELAVASTCLHEMTCTRGLLADFPCTGCHELGEDYTLKCTLSRKQTSVCHPRLEAASEGLRLLAGLAGLDAWWRLVHLGLMSSQAAFT
jgi:hypothetical protein